MALLEYLTLGLNTACGFNNLIYCFAGVFIGTLIGVLPGIGPPGAIAILLPMSFGISPASAIIMLAGIYYGSQYGGTITSVLVNIPGESSSVVTCLDGYKMARMGRAGPALSIAAFGSFIAGTASIFFLIFLAVPLSAVTLKFGPPEYAAVMVLGLTIVTYLAHGSTLKAIIMALLGVGLSQIGTDLISGRLRFTFGLMELEKGIDLIPLAMGLFGIAEILIAMEEPSKREILKTKARDLFPSSDDWKASTGPIWRGTILGFFVGMLPGGGAVISSFVSYALEKKLSRHPEKFGTGIIEGVAGPESANNSATVGAFIPLFALGIPSNAVTALLLGALMIHGLQPGPMILRQNPEIFWGTAMSMYFGNVFLLILNIPIIGLWVRILKISRPILFPIIILFCIIGSYAVNNSVFDVFVMFGFGIIGYLFRKLHYEPAPLILAFVLTPMLEDALRQSLIISEGSFLIFFYRPIAGVVIITTFFLLFASSFSYLKRLKGTWTKAS